MARPTGSPTNFVNWWGVDFADSDGYGMRDNGEVKVYGVMNENLEFVVPFRPMPEVKALLQQLREQYKQNSK